MNIDENNKTISCCQAEQFVALLHNIAVECNLESVTYNAFGVTEFVFEDGSHVGGIRTFIDAGIIKEENYNKHYKDI